MIEDIDHEEDKKLHKKLHKQLKLRIIGPPIKFNRKSESDNKSI